MAWFQRHDCPRQDATKASTSAAMIASKPPAPLAPHKAGGRQQQPVVVPAHHVPGAQQSVEVRDLRAAERRIRSDVAGVRQQVAIQQENEWCPWLLFVILEVLLLFFAQFGLLALDRAACGGQVALHLWTKAEHAIPIGGGTLVVYLLDLIGAADDELSPDGLVLFVVGSTVVLTFAWELYVLKTAPGCCWRPSFFRLFGGGGRRCCCAEVAYSPRLAEARREVRGLLLCLHLLLVLAVWLGWYLASDGAAGLLCALIAVLYYAAGTLLGFSFLYGLALLGYLLCLGTLWVLHEACRTPVVLCWRWRAARAAGHGDDAAAGAAGAVVVGGAAGPCADKVNGRYEATADREVYAKAGDPGRWLFVATNGKWMVGPTRNKDARNAAGHAYQAAAAGGRPPAAGSAVAWKVSHGKSSPWVEQRLRVEAQPPDAEDPPAVRARAA